jgi:hypothetical protein
MIAEELEIDLDDPMGQLIEHADRFISRNKDPLISGFAQALGSFFHPGPRPARESEPYEVPRQAPPRQQPRHEPPPPRQPPSQVAPKENAKDVLGFGKDVKLTRAMIKERQRALAKLMHEDVGGSTRAMQRINEAVNELLKTVK